MVGSALVLILFLPVSSLTKVMEYRLDVQIRHWGGLRIVWTAGLKGLWPAASSPAKGPSLVMYTRDWSQYWSRYYFTSSVMAWMTGQSATSASLQINTKLQEVVGEPDSCTVLLRDLNTLDKWVYSTLSCIRSVAGRLRKVILPISSALVRQN